MLLDWFTLLSALVLLLTPIGLFHGDRVHYRAISRDWSRHWTQILSLRLHLLDLARSAIGAWLLVHSVTRMAEHSAAEGYVPLLGQAAALGAAAALQTLFCKAPRATHAPFAFVAGIVLGYCPPTVALFALALAAVLAAGVRMPALFFPLLGLCTLAAGVLFLGQGAAPRLAVIAGATALPWIVALLFSRHLVISYLTRQSSRAATAGRSPELR